MPFGQYIGAQEFIENRAIGDCGDDLATVYTQRTGRDHFFDSPREQQFTGIALGERLGYPFRPIEVEQFNLRLERCYLFKRQAATQEFSRQIHIEWHKQHFS